MDVEMTALGEIACDLPWLVPSADSLAALARPAAAPLLRLLRCDPAAVILLLRSDQRSSLEIALEHLGGGAIPFVDWNESGPDIVYHNCLKIAATAQALAIKVQRCDPERAWLTGLLAPLGWLALC